MATIVGSLSISLSILFNLVNNETDKYIFQDYHRDAFQELKDYLASGPILRFPDWTKPFYLKTDGSGFSIGGKICQDFEDGEHPVAMSSRGLNAAEKYYSGPKKEVLALVYHMNYFKVYLWGRHFVARVDHRALKWLDQWKDKGIVARWLETITDFNFTVEHVPGKAFVDVDSLSRQELPEPKMAAMEELKRNPQPAGVSRSKCNAELDEKISKVEENIPWDSITSHTNKNCHETTTHLREFINLLDNNIRSSLKLYHKNHHKYQFSPNTLFLI